MRSATSPTLETDGEQLPDRIRAEIRERLKASDAAVREYERLEAALDALGGVAAEEPAGGGRAPAASRKRPAARRRVARPAKRAPRGANREAALRVIGERAGVTVAELPPLPA